MKLSTLRIVAAFSLTTLLAACGGAPADQLGQETASAQAGVTATATAMIGAASASTAPGSAIASTSAASGAPAPDCAAEGCNSPRIIDGNAEAFRYAAMQHAAGADTPQS